MKKEKQQFDHIRVIEFEEQIGPCRMDKVALFNSNRVSTEEAFHLIRAGEYSDNVLVMSRKQWTSLFGDMKE